MSALRLLVILLPTAWLLPGTADADDVVVPARVVFDGPHTLPAGAGVTAFTFRAVDEQNRLLADYSGQGRISGLAVAGSDSEEDSGTDLDIRFADGVLQVTPPDGSSHLFVVSGTLTLTTEQTEWTFQVHQRPAWLRLLPPVLAICLAVLLKDVIVSLILAILSGCLLYYPLTDVSLAIPVFCEVMVRQVADFDHASVILFTLLLGAMTGLMNDSGGTGAAIERLTRVARTRRRGMALTWLMGLLVFFDDYANTMLIGGAMRPLSDRLKFSRAKLAFLIDSTAAPIAGLAISTWTAFEIDQVAAGFEAAGIEGNAADFFWSTIPYRFYPLLMIVVVGTIAISGRDFGAMLRAERNQVAHETLDQKTLSHGSPWLAVLPVLSLVGITVAGFVRDVDAYQLLLIASFAASSLAFVLAWIFSPLTLEECSRSWVAGISSMMSAVTVLVLAWGVSAVCHSSRLDTAGYLIGLIGDSVSASFLPAIAFLLSGAIAVAIGSSFTTMALLVPMLLPLAWTVLSGTDSASLDSPLLGATIGAILAGAIFGDHCSPISDTTVLSSAASGCEHLRHVSTQLPYALLTAAASLLLGYLPVGFGVPWWICLPAATLVCVGGIVLLGQDSDVSPS